jgi:hypothetical protein
MRHVKPYKAALQRTLSCLLLLSAAFTLSTSCSDDKDGRGTTIGAISGVFSGGSVAASEGMNATTYPSMLSVSGMTGPINSVKVVLNGVTSLNPGDSIISLRSPDGFGCDLTNASAFGPVSFPPVSNVVWTFDANTSTPLSTTADGTGTYRADPLYCADPHVFEGTNPNGTWLLRVRDRGVVAGNGISIASWTLDFTSSTPNQAPQITAPAIATTDDATPLAFTGPNAISVSDPDLVAGNTTASNATSDQLQVNLSVPWGSLTLDSSTLGGLTVLDPPGDGNVSVLGSQDDLNAALATLIYTPLPDQLGERWLSIAVSDLSGGPASLDDGEEIEIDVGGCVGNNGTGDDDTDRVCNDLDHRPLIFASSFSSNQNGCATGGVAVRTGIDEDNDGALSSLSDTVNPPVYVCNGATGNQGTQGVAGVAGTAVVYSLTPAGSQCANGGWTLEIASDTNPDGVLDSSDSQLSASNLCNGLNSAVRVSGGNPDCPAGGTLLSVGIDSDGDGSLSLTEVTLPPVNVCNGLNALVETQSIATGSPDCANGGFWLTIGTDTNGDGSLLGEAVPRKLCNGTNALTRVEPVLGGPTSMCPTGGQLISVGNDDDGNGALDLIMWNNNSSSSPGLGEADSQAMICNGLNAVTLNTPIPPQSPDCPAGGTLLQVGIDDNANGVLDLPLELDGQHILCSGVVSAVRLTPLGSDPAVCPTGGVLLESGLDLDGDQVLGPNERQLDENLCHGLNGLVETTPLGAGSSECPNGGVTFTVGTDANGNGILDGNEGQSRTLCNGLNSLTTVTPLAADPEVCPTGGQTIAVGLDDDGNGRLDNNVAIVDLNSSVQLVSEIDSSAVICNGLNSLVLNTPIPRLSLECPEGGTRIDVGTDRNGNGALDPNESDAHQVLCSGINSAVRLTPLPADPAVCASGGIRIATGLDLDASGVLEEGEDQSTANVCHGLNGLVLSEAIEPGDGTCPAGGQRFRVGLDSNHDGDLTGAEIARSDVLCNGRDLVTASSPRAANPAECPFGGQLISMGTDLNANGVLDVPTEVQSTAVVCSGQAAVSKQTNLPRDAAVCAEGGVQLEVGIDRNGNAALDDGEGTGTSVICFGIRAAVRVVALVADPAVCPAGGIRVLSGSDVDGNGVLDDAEATGTSQTVCNGANSLTRTTLLAPDAAVCSAGGSRVDGGPDSNGNGTLEDAEVTASSTLCRASNLAVRTQRLAAGDSSCPEGGTSVQTGIDKNANGILEDGEVTNTDRLCSQLPLLFDTSVVFAGEVGADAGTTTSCPFGGERLRLGHDDGEKAGIAGDGILQDDEVDVLRDICYATSNNSGTIDPDQNCSLPASTRAAHERMLWMLIGLGLLLLRQRRRAG